LPVDLSGIKRDKPGGAPEEHFPIRGVKMGTAVIVVELQSVGDPVIDKGQVVILGCFIWIKPRNPLIGGQLQTAVGVLNNTVNGIVRQIVIHMVGPERIIPGIIAV